MSSSPAESSHLSAGPSSSSRPTTSNNKQKKQFLAELNGHLYEFVVRLLPTQDELAIKEDVRKLLEKLIRTIEPDSTLFAFGSTANGFSLRNSDMDLCCLIDSGKPPLHATDLVTMVGDLLERETKFVVKTLPHARIPIIKLSLSPSPGLPFGIACDIGFENRLALENTRMLHTYASFDPARVRTMVLFLKVWCKRRKINSPYEGTLSSYGYVLIVIYFLVHVKSPPVLPNLQQATNGEERRFGEHNVWFCDDIESLRHRWQSSNTQTVAELLVDLFKYYARDFPYNTGIASIRAGPLKKSDKGWTTDYSSRRDGNRLCIEDPFETDFNVGRCVTKEGLYLIRGEFMRAARILTVRPENALVAIAQLCAERDDNATSNSGIPPAPPYTVGARPNGPGTLPLPIPLPHPARSPSVSDADEFGDDGELSTADDASIASAPMHARRVASSSGAQDGLGFGFSQFPNHYNHHPFTRGRPALPAVATTSNLPQQQSVRSQQQQQASSPAAQDGHPPGWTPSRHPPGFISHHSRRSASAGAEPRRGSTLAFTPYSAIAAKAGESSRVSQLQQPYQPQFAELHQRRQQMRRKSSRSRSRGSSDSGDELENGSGGSGPSPEETTPRNANFRVPPIASGMVMSVPPTTTTFIPGMPSHMQGAGAGPSARRDRELPPRAQHWRMPLMARDRERDRDRDRERERDRAGMVEDLARMRVQEDRTPRAQPQQPPQSQSTPTPRPPPATVTPPRIEIIPACPATESPPASVTVKAR